MKIVIATGIYPPHIGGPAQYTKGIEEAWKKKGHEVTVLTYGVERRLPPVIRHLYFFLRCLGPIANADQVVLLDTLSTGVPALLAANFKRCEEALRVLEEYGRVMSPKSVKGAQALRFKVYQWERKLSSTALTKRASTS